MAKDPNLLPNNSWVKILPQKWLWVFSCALIIAAALLFFAIDTLDHAAQFGEYLSGFSAALAFLWLVAGFRLQSAELAMQREELKLQRIAAENQAKEMRNTARFSSLSQIETLLQRAVDRIVRSDLGIKTPVEIPQIWIAGMGVWKILLETTDPTLYQQEYSIWLKSEGCAREYLSNVSQALKIYVEHNTELQFDPSQSDEAFLYFNSSWMSKVPYLSEHFGATHIIASMVYLYEPGLKALRLGYLYATKVLIPDAVKSDMLDEELEKIRTSGGLLPAIVAI